MVNNYDKMVYYRLMHNLIQEAYKKMKRCAKTLIAVMLVALLLMSNFAMIVSYAAIQDYPVELAFNNIFVFDKWASNALSTTIVSNGKPVDDELEINVEEGSFRFNNPYSGEAYTGHGMSTGADAAGNYQYYMMEVEPSSAYTFSYNATITTSFITPYVFFFNEENEYVSLVAQPFSGSGDTGFVFVAPANARYIQIRFTVPETGYADIRDIAIRKSEVSSYGNNIFDFDLWSDNTMSGKVSDDANYNSGTIAKNAEDKSVTLTTKAGTGILFTNFTFGNGNGYYMMDVEPNTPYNLSYNLASCSFAVGSYQPYIVYYNANGDYISYVNTESVGLGSNRFVFMTPANAEFIQIVYGIVGIAEAGNTCTVKDVSVQKLNLEADASAGLPHRLVYTYSRNSTSTYGELPVPTYAPDGYVFAGWYTGKNGTGTLITENTAVDFSSYTVYPHYDPIAETLTVVQEPVKTSYTVGERVNSTGLVLEATVGGITRRIDSGFYCTPEYLTATGEQTITAHYGGKTAAFKVNVSASASKSVVVNGSTVNVSVTNNVYSFGNGVSTGEFNRYEITYYSDAYVKGVTTYTDGTTEVFFLEPSSNFDSENGEFTSFIDGYLEKVINANSTTNRINTHTRNGIKSISFTLLDNKSGSFDLLSFTTSKAAVDTADTTKYFTNSKYKVGIDILNGGVVTYLEVLNSNIVARVYNTTDAYGNETTMTRVDYADKLPDGYVSESKNVNLINYYDNGRELQQSYYGTGEKPYEQGYYNRADWNYNPVQAGNVINEASKVIDYEITDDYIYIKARPLDWAKWSDDFANKSSSDAYEPIYGDEYITDTYVEAKYVFEDGMIKTYCRMVDYSGYPSAQTTQELPAFYTIEPLNHYVYNDVSEDEAWKTKNLKYDKEPEFWGIAQEYRDYHYPNGFDANVDCAEHWAAFTASEDAGSFGIGLYSPEVTDFFYGVYPQKYSEEIVDGTFKQTDYLNYRHAHTLNPAIEDDSSYIAPIGVRTFESFKPTEFSYYISTGTVDQIRNSFGVVDDEGFAEKMSSGKITVPETVYMTPSTGESKTGQYYVNNILDKATNTVTPEADNDNTNAVVQFNIPGAKDVTIAVNTITSGIGDIVLNEAGNIQAGVLTNSYEGIPLGAVIDADGYFSYGTAGLYINGTGLTPGQTAVAEWIFTITMDDGSIRTYYAYSTLYAPNYHSVGATAEARYNSSNRVDSAGWISGVHSVSTSLAPFGKNSGVDGSGAFKSEPLLDLSKPMTPQGWGSANNLTTSSDGNVYAREFYKTSEGGSNEQSPVGILYVDYSRNKNTNTIPNVYVGAELLKADNNSNNDGTHFYAFYTLGTGSEFTDPSDSGTPSGWTQFVTLTSSNGTHTGTVASTLTISDLSNFRNVLNDANSDRSLRIYTAPNLTIKESGTQYIYLHSQIRKYSGKYANTYSAVQLVTLNKADLRTLVLEATTLNAANYTADSWNNYIKELRIASQNLGNPSASSVIDTSALVAARNALQTVVTLNANGGSFNGSAAKQFNATVGSDYSVTYDLSDHTPVRSGYVLAGWSTDANATEGSMSVKAGLMPTLYAVWTESGYNIVYNSNGGSGFIDSQTVKYSENVTLASYGFTKPGYTLLGWSTNASATTATYSPAQSVSGLAEGNGATVTLYAVWSENKYTVQFNANDGSGNVTSKTVRYSESFALPSEIGSNAGTLLGWSTSAYATTADYQPGQTVSKITNENNAVITLYAVWFNVGAVDDTVVIEYGIPVVIDVLTNDNSVESVNAIGTQGVTDDDTDLKKHTSSILSNGTDTLTLANGNAVLNADGTITYTPVSTNASAEDVFFYEVKVSDTSYYYAKVTVIPATTMYYEDTFFEFADSEVVKNDVTYKYEWQNLGESVSGVFQSADRPGEFDIVNDTDNVYGYDSAFDGMVSYSGGSAHFVEVDQIAGSNTPTATFTFTGTGFDLFAVTDYNSGTITATIYRGTEVKAANRVQGIISNTYFGYDYNSETDEYVPADNGALFQIPVVRARDLSYDTYTVVLAPRYNKAFDVANTGKCGVYVDSVRIFDPMGDDNDTANEAYMADGEFAPEYIEIRDTLVQPNADGSYSITDNGYNSSVFIDGNKTSLEDFAKLGPKNEVYLGNGNSVAFHIVTEDLPATVQLGMRLTGVNGSTADVKLLNGNSDEWIESVTLNSTTERYYNIENVVEWEEQDNGTFKTVSPVIIHNTSDAVISLTSLKWAYGSANSSEPVLYIMSYEQTPETAAMAISRAIETETRKEILDKDNISFGFSKEVYTFGDSGVLTVETPQGVAAVIINGTDAVSNGTDEDGRMIWVYEFTADTAGTMTFEIIAGDEDGFTSESVFASADVENAADNTPETPDDETPGDTSDSTDNSSCFDKFILFIYNHIVYIINILKTILSFVTGGVTV